MIAQAESYDRAGLSPLDEAALLQQIDTLGARTVELVVPRFARAGRMAAAPLLTGGSVWPIPTR